MQVTKAVDYGLRALLVLGHRPPSERHFLNDLAKSADVPRNYLVKILKSLCHAGIVLSFRGVKGGFALAKDPGEVTLRHIVEAIDGPVGVMSCLLSPGGCPRDTQCVSQETFREVRERLLAELQSYSLSDLLRRDAEIKASRPAGKTVGQAAARSLPASVRGASPAAGGTV